MVSRRRKTAGEQLQLPLSIDDPQDDGVIVNTDNDEPVPSSEPAVSLDVEPEPEFEPERAPESELASPDAHSDMPIDTLRREYEALRESAKRADAERAAAVAEAARQQQILAAREQDLYAAQRVALENGEHLTRANLQSAQQELLLARAANDVQREVDALQTINANQARLLQLQNSRNALQEPRPAAPLSDFEVMTANVSPPSREWLSRHKDDIFTGEPWRIEKVRNGHQQAVSRGIQPDTDAYFTYLDTYMSFKSDPEPSKTVKRAASVPAAPANNAGSSHSNNNTVRLNKEEQEMAIAIFPHLTRAQALKEYAKGKVSGGSTHMRSADKYR